MPIPAHQSKSTLGPGRPSTACSTCKAQKIRCSGDRPSCKRCVRLAHRCVYRGRSEAKKPQTKSKTRLSTLARNVEHHISVESRLHLSGTAQELPRFPGEPDDDQELVGIPRALLSTLVEIYFENVYQSHLLFHKQRFLESLSKGNIRPHIILTVCAWGANFYRDETGKPVFKENGLMVDWAKRAGRLVFQEAEDLNEENVVTFCNLALFWHSQGSWRISQLHKGNAYQLLQISGLISSKKLQADDSLDSEIRRRRVWACYLMHCYGSEKPSLFGTADSIQNLPLPWPDDDFDQESSTCRHACLGNGESNGGVFSEVIVGLTLWSSVVSSIKSSDCNMSNKMTNIHAFDEKISQWWRAVPPRFKLISDNIQNTPKAALPKLLLLNVVYHQCLCALHSSIVPLFCWSACEETWLSARQLSAQTAFEHAGTISSLIEASLRAQINTDAFPSFVPYAAYCGCAIQIPFMWSPNQRVQHLAYRNVESNVKLIRHLARNWKLALILGVQAGYLYRVHEDRSTVIEDEPKLVDPTHLTNFRPSSIRANVSISDFTGILRSTEAGYAKPGEEMVGLETEPLLGDSPKRLHNTSTRASKSDLFRDFLELESQLSEYRSGNISPSSSTINSHEVPCQKQGRDKARGSLQGIGALEQNGSMGQPLEQIDACNGEPLSSDTFNLFFDPNIGSLFPGSESLFSSLLNDNLYTLDSFGLE